MLGQVLGAGLLGNVFGPVIGTLAVVVGTAIVFTTIAAATTAMAVILARTPTPPRAPQRPAASIRTALGTPAVLVGLWLVLLPAGSISVVTTLIPLQLAARGIVTSAWVSFS